MPNRQQRRQPKINETVQLSTRPTFRISPVPKSGRPRRRAGGRPQPLHLPPGRLQAASGYRPADYCQSPLRAELCADATGIVKHAAAHIKRASVAVNGFGVGSPRSAAGRAGGLSAGICCRRPTNSPGDCSVVFVLQGFAVSKQTNNIEE